MIQIIRSKSTQQLVNNISRNWNSTKQCFWITNRSLSTSNIPSRPKNLQIILSIKLAKNYPGMYKENSCENFLIRLFKFKSSLCWQIFDSPNQTLGVHKLCQCVSHDQLPSDQSIYNMRPRASPSPGLVKVLSNKFQTHISKARPVIGHFDPKY